MVAYDGLSDKELIAFMRSGDHLAFTEIYDRYHSLLYVYACKIIKDEDLAQDILQELFIYLWDKRDIIDFKTSMSSYLYTAVRFRFFDLVDKQKVRKEYIQNFQIFLDKGEYHTDNYVTERELAAIIEKEINHLPAKLREIFLLSRRENLTNREIADRLKISEKTVKNQLSLALRELRGRLGLFAFFFCMFYL